MYRVTRRVLFYVLVAPFMVIFILAIVAIRFINCMSWTEFTHNLTENIKSLWKSVLHDS